MFAITNRGVDHNVLSPIFHEAIYGLTAYQGIINKLLMSGISQYDSHRKLLQT